jgi:hypothetical protein
LEQSTLVLENTGSISTWDVVKGADYEFSEKWLNQFFIGFEEETDRPIFEIEKNTQINNFFSKILMKMDVPGRLLETGPEIIIRKRHPEFPPVDFIIYIDLEVGQQCVEKNIAGGGDP